MPFESIPDKERENNVYARNVKGETIHISEAESGRKGYFCLGCDRELQAVRPKKENIISYFRHDPKDVDKKTGICTYRDETYRHQLAKIILQRIKQIKVPAIYKYPPKGITGLAALLEESKFIDAHAVEVEKDYYENEDGVVCSGPKGSVESKYLHVKPDVIFLDKYEKPILFIELIATHGITTEKKIMLKRLGIDCIQVRIPKDSPQSIEDCFYVTERTKWIYNYVEESTEYLPISNGNTEGVSSIDEEQRKLFEESFKCRQAQIGNLIRSIKRCLESKPYRDVEESIRRELSRVERNTKEHRSRLDKLREECRERAVNELGSKLWDFEEEKTDFDKEERKFEAEYKDLERRYKSKKGELEDEGRILGEEEELIEQAIQREFEKNGGGGNSFEYRKREIESETNRIRDKIQQLEQLISENTTEEERIEREFEESRGRIVQKFESIERTHRDKLERIGEAIEKTADEEGGLPEFFKSKETDLPGEFELKEDELGREFEELRKHADRAVASRHINEESKLSRRIKTVLDAGKLLEDYAEKLLAFRRNRKAWDAYQEGTYKNWS